MEITTALKPQKHKIWTCVGSFSVGVGVLDIKYNSLTNISLQMNTKIFLNAPKIDISRQTVDETTVFFADYSA